MEIHWAGMNEIDASEQERVAERLERLAGDRTDLIDVRISGHETGHHRHGDKEVRIACQARGRSIVAARTRPDLGLALNEALDVFEREIHRLRERRRDLGRGGPPAAAELGIVDRIFREDGYGFILTDAGEQVYFHRNALKEGLDFDALEEAERVALSVEPGREGTQATAVTRPPFREG